MYRIIAEPYAWVLRRARPGDYFFGDTDMNYITGLPNPTPLPWVSNDGYTRPEQVQKVLDSLERHRARFVELNSEMRAEAGPDNSLKPFLQYLYSHYRLAAKFEDGTDIFERAPEASSQAESRTRSVATSPSFQVPQKP